MTDPSLEQSQQWMKTVIVERGTLGEKLSSAERATRLSLEEVVAEARGLSAQLRVSLYTNGYVLRLLDCMRADFPVLRKFVGDVVFDAFARAYIITEPPRSYSLFDLGADFPEFLANTKPKDSLANVEMIPWLDLPEEIARLERAQTEVLRARGLEDRQPAPEILTIDILSQNLIVSAPSCLRLLETKFSLLDLFNEDNDLEPQKSPPHKQTFVAVSRANYVIHTQEIEDWQFAFLQSCRSGPTAHAAIESAAQAGSKDKSELLAGLLIWLPLAISLGFVAVERIEKPNPDIERQAV